MLKAIARQIPQIDRLLRQRDDLLQEVERLRQTAANDHQPQQRPYDRRDLALRHLNLDGLGLEIGPSFSPLVSKADGYRVEIIDHADADQLRKKYDGDQDTSRIEEVDYISNGSIFDAVGKPSRYDYIVASHVIEHMPNMLGFLKDCERLLKPNGRLSLAAPDKRYCFDIFQGLTTTGQVLQAHLDGATRPSPGTLFDQVANAGSRQRNIAWLAGDTRDLAFHDDLAAAKSAYHRARTTSDYMDAHVWRFVPSSFRLILSDLNALGETALRELSFEAPGGMEFFCVLSREGQGCPFDRLSLAKQAIMEHAATSV